ncbi:MAG: hypothetical protein OCC49_20150 [Fibrobacterales bacterium]
MLNNFIPLLLLLTPILFANTNCTKNTIDGIKVETCSSKYKNGALKKKYHRITKGTFHGSFQKWYNNGQLKSLTKYIKGCPIDSAVSYFDDGTLRHKNIYKNCKKHGKSIEYYKSKQIKALDHYQEGIAQDTSKFWYENGQLKERYSFKAGEQYGVKQTWWPNGNLKYEEDRIYSTNKKAAEKYNYTYEKEYFESGKLNYEIHYGPYDTHNRLLESNQVLKSYVSFHPDGNPFHTYKKQNGLQIVKAYTEKDEPCLTSYIINGAIWGTHATCDERLLKRYKRKLKKHQAWLKKK